MDIKEALVDENIPLNIPEGMLLHADLIDDYGILWQSKTSSPKEMEWVVSMTSQSMESVYIKKGIDPTLISLKILDRGKIASEMRVKQHYLSRGVRYEERGEGRIYYPATPLAKIGVIVMSGSGGGRPDTRAALLASRGFVAYALPYFRYGNLPPRLERIPLEYFQKAIEQFRKEVDLVALMGTSKGGEAALLLGTFCHIDKIVAYVPSCATYGGFPRFHLPSWTYRGKDFPIAPIIVPSEVTRPIRATPFFLSAIDQIASARIPVEKIQCPLLVISGSDDQMWPSQIFGNKIKEKCPHAIHLTYEGAGHMIAPPYIPLTVTTIINPLDGNRYEMGGTLKPHLTACTDSWKHVLQFLSNPRVS
ncbi:MAG: hypothetical protein KBC64_07405 [Simkaniaceae bacterium]|nr:hypothetical protein [Simkaniaceae bacterium]